MMSRLSDVALWTCWLRHTWGVTTSTTLENNISYITMWKWPVTHLAWNRTGCALRLSDTSWTRLRRLWRRHQSLIQLLSLSLIHALSSLSLPMRSTSLFRCTISYLSLILPKPQQPFCQCHLQIWKPILTQKNVLARKSLLSKWGR